MSLLDQVISDAKKNNIIKDEIPLVSPSLNPTDKTITDLWIKEAKERKNQIELNQTELINGDEVFRKIANRLK